MKIGFVQLEGPGALDRLITTWSQALLARGVRVRGLVRDYAADNSQVGHDDRGDHRCDMTLRILPGGPTFYLSQRLGTGSKGCRIDPNALEAASLAVENSLDPNTQLLLVNRFGKFEARGRGLVTSIARAEELGVPVLCGVSSLNIEALRAFTEGQSVSVKPTTDALDNWLNCAQPLDFSRCHGRRRPETYVQAPTALTTLVSHPK